MRNINNIYKIIKDYRSEDNNGIGMVDRDRIEKWITQFKIDDRQFILDETLHLLKNRYLPKSNIEKNLLGAIKTMAKSYDNSTDLKKFLSNAVFLDQQPPGKSQGIILDLIKNSIKKNFQIDIASSNLDKINEHSSSDFIYFDDVLCTGNTFYQDISEFLQKLDKNGNQYFRELIDNKIHLHCCFIFLHLLNKDKKMTQLKIQVSDELYDHDNFHYYAKKSIDNYSNGNMEMLIPQGLNQSELVISYKDKINNQVDEYIKGRYYRAEEYYRKPDSPQSETFFTNRSSRDRYTNIILEKGIEILNNSSSSKPNIRPLGYSLPSLRDFGYGTFCFTWRNVPNNTPLVFWYTNENFTPLFPKKVTGENVISLTLEDMEKLFGIKS
jgi:hypothetical protein